MAYTIVLSQRYFEPVGNHDRLYVTFNPGAWQYMLRFSR